MYIQKQAHKVHRNRRDVLIRFCIVEKMVTNKREHNKPSFDLKVRL